MAKTRFTTGVGRLVQGSVDEAQTKDAQGNLRVVKTGPNAGQPNPQFFIAVAFPKADPQGEFAAFWQLLCAQAHADFPALFPNGPNGQSVHPQFSFKVIDGDGPDQNGKPNSDKEGFAGHWVVRFASAYPPRCFHAGRYSPQEQIQEKGAIKRGYYVRVSGAVDGNGNTQRPGLYLNLDMVELSAYGPEITSGPDAGQAFGGGPATLPAGASAAPLTPPAAGPGPGPGNAAPPPPAAAPPSPGAGSPAGGKVMLPAANGATYEQLIAAGWTDALLVERGMMQAPAAAPAVTPYAGYMAPPPGPGGPTPPAPGAGAPPPPTGPGVPSAPGATASPGSAVPPAPAAAPPPVVPLAHVMLPAANGATYEQLIAAGWTDDTLRQHGMMQ